SLGNPPLLQLPGVHQSVLTAPDQVWTLNTSRSSIDSICGRKAVRPPGALCRRLLLDRRDQLISCRYQLRDMMLLLSRNETDRQTRITKSTQVAPTGLRADGDASGKARGHAVQPGWPVDAVGALAEQPIMRRLGGPRQDVIATIVIEIPRCHRHASIR